MTLNHLIVLIACVLLVCVHQSTAANLGCLNINLNKVCRKHENLRNEVEDIWAVIATSGIQKQDYGNKTRTDDLGINAQELIAKVNGTLATIQGLKTEVKHLIVSSRNGFKHEKSWQREAIRNTTKVCDDFQTEMTKENDNLKQKIRDMQENNQQKLNNIDKENQKMRGDFEAETETLKQTVHKMQNDYEQIRTELSKLQATTTTLTTTPLPTITTTTIPILCDGDWEHFNGHCYLVVLQHKSWDDASAYCASKYSYLIEITTDTESEFVTELVRDYRFYRFWIGATDRDTTERFIYYHSKLPIPENYWREGQPDNRWGNEHCVDMYRYTSSRVVELYDGDCTFRIPFVCEKSAA